LARIGEIGKQLQGMRGPPNAGQVKEIFDAIYDLVDINQDGAISKSEISGLLQRILVGLGEVPQALLQIISDTLDQNFFDTIAKAGFEFLPMLKMMGVDITDEKGNIMYTKCAPFLAMADGAVKAKAQQAMLQDKAKKAVEKYMEAEKKYLERLSKLADKDGFVTKDDYMTLMSTIANEASDILKEQVTTGLTHLPPSSQQIAMLVAGFVDPASILKSVITAKPFIFERTLSAMFDNFGTNGKLNLSGLRSIYECIAGVADARVKNSDPATRMKAVFDLIGTCCCCCCCILLSLASTSSV